MVHGVGGAGRGVRAAHDPHPQCLQDHGRRGPPLHGDPHVGVLAVHRVLGRGPRGGVLRNGRWRDLRGRLRDDVVVAAAERPDMGVGGPRERHAGGARAAALPMASRRTAALAGARRGLRRGALGRGRPGDGGGGARRGGRGADRVTGCGRTGRGAGGPRGVAGPVLRRGQGRETAQRDEEDRRDGRGHQGAATAEPAGGRGRGGLVLRGEGGGAVRPGGRFPDGRRVRRGPGWGGLWFGGHGCRGDGCRGDGCRGHRCRGLRFGRPVRGR